MTLSLAQQGLSFSRTKDHRKSIQKKERHQEGLRYRQYPRECITLLVENTKLKPTELVLSYWPLHDLIPKKRPSCGNECKLPREEKPSLKF